MNRCLLITCGLLTALSGAACSSLAPTQDPARVVRGPLTTRQQHPLGLTLMAFRPRRPVTQESGTSAHGVQLSWSSIEEIQHNPPSSPNTVVAFDGETARATLRTRYGVADKVDVEVEVPFLWAGGGGVDAFIEDFHDFFFLPKGGRDKTDDDLFEMNLASDGDPLYSLEGNTVQIQDIPIFLTYQLLAEEEGTPALAARVGLELPIGSEDRGFGNGALDYGAGLIAEKSFGRWTVSGGFDVVQPGQSDKFDRSEKHELLTQVALELGGELRWNDHWSLLVGAVWTSRMVDSIELEEINREIFDLGIGASIDTGARSRLAFSIHEDLVAATGSDVTAQLGWTWGY